MNTVHSRHSASRHGGIISSGLGSIYDTRELCLPSALINILLTVNGTRDSIGTTLTPFLKMSIYICIYICIYIYTNI